MRVSLRPSRSVTGNRVKKSLEGDERKEATAVAEVENFHQAMGQHV